MANPIGVRQGRCRYWAALVFLLFSVMTDSGLGATPWANFSMDVRREAIEREDGVKLYGTLFLPRGNVEGQLLPAILQINPWSLPGEVYYMQARRLASLGFVVLSYTARGFGASGGTICGGGRDDVQDAMAWIDWLVANAPVDEHRIGTMGMSMGAGIALLTAAADPRVSVVASLSGWGDFYRAMSEQGTVPDVWEGVLLWAGKTLGRMDVKLRTFMERVKAYDMPEEKMRMFAAERSPVLQVDTYNRRGVAIYIQHNYQDYLFATNQIIDFFNRLTTDKKLDLNFGVHLTPEFMEIANPSSELWGRVVDWFYDRLIAMPERLPSRSAPYVVASKVKFSKEKLHFSTWPPAVDRRSYTLSYADGASSGQMLPATQEAAAPAQKTIASGAYTGISTGIPILSAALEAHVRLPVLQFTQAMGPKGTMFFTSPKLEDKALFFGAAHVDMWIVPSAAKIQLVGYLFTVNSLGLATLVTHAPLTFLDGQPGQPRRIAWNLIFSAHELPRGESLLFAVDTHDPYYARPSKDPYTVTFLFGEQYPASLQLPLLQDSRPPIQ